MANLTPQGGNADLAGKTVITIDGYEVSYDAAGFARRSVSPGGQVKYYDALGNQVGAPTTLEVSPAQDPSAPVLPVSTQMPISDVIPRSDILSSKQVQAQDPNASIANQTAAIERINAARATPAAPLGTVQEQIIQARASGAIPPEQPLTAQEQANIDALNRIEANKATPAAPLGSIQEQIIRARATGDIPPEQPLTAQEQANIDALNRIEANKAAPAEPLGSIQEQIAQARVSGAIPLEQPLTAEEQANIDALNRIEANRANPVESLGTVQEQIVQARAAGDIPPEQPLTAQEQANIDALNRIEANRANPVESLGTVQEQIIQARAAGDIPPEQPLTAQEQANIDALNRIEANKANPVSEDPILAVITETGVIVEQPNVTSPTPVIGTGVAYDEFGNLQPGYRLDANNNPVFVGGNYVAPATAAQAAADRAAALTALAQQQAVLSAQKKMANNGDWRVRLSLAPGANYLYNDPDGPGILGPLSVTDGVIFPYTPKIDIAYKADYDSYALTHSNYKGYFYKSSYADAVNMSATFTAQDTAEANYLLAVIHFFRSVTKMFYGQDAQRGAPPPMVYLTGLGQYQFSAHPCVVTSFNYSLPSDVDYIRARSTNINGANMLTRRDKQDLPTNPISGAVARLKNLFNSQGIKYGAETSVPAPPTLGQNQPTYVPTRMEMTISLLPMQSRQQVSKVFSLKNYANGNLLKGGYW